MSDDRLRKCIEVKDHEIAEELLRLVKDNSERRGSGKAEFEPEFGELLGMLWESNSEAKVRHAIGRADLWQSSLKVSIQLRPARSPIDWLFERVRLPLHELVVFYVELMARRQKTFNVHIIGAMRLLLDIIQRQSREDQSREVAELKAEIRRLREQVERLEDVIEQQIGDSSCR